jgi:hypothetical protein
MARARPDFFIVGAAKAGTTALFGELGRHPGVFLPDVKEPHHFAPEGALYVPRGVSDDHVLARRQHGFFAIANPDRYQAGFQDARPDQLAGEASTSYLTGPGPAERIHQARPDAKLIAIVRDPVERAFSHYLMHVRRQDVRLPFERATRDDWVDDAGRTVPNSYLELSRYGARLDDYRRHFPRDQIRVVLFEEFARDPAPVVADLLEWLGLDPEALARAPPARTPNQFGEPRGWVARRMLQFPLGQPLARALLPRGLRRILLDRVLLRRSAKPRLDEAVRRRLRETFQPDVDRFAAVWGERFAEEWGYRGGTAADA